MAARAARAFDPNGTIKPQKNEFDDNFLDVVGTEFKFDHAKGLAEWMKNAADAYSTTARVKDGEQFILLRFKPGRPKKESVFECVDFVGMTKENIDKALKVWGLATAAKRGTNLKTFGGHGNGGKFYMRQMFDTSRFITYRGGLLNVFGFDPQKHYGYAKNCENVKSSLEDALRFAGIDTIDVPESVKRRWKRNPKAVGFTVVRGERPERFSGKATIAGLLERLRIHPQARRLLQHKQVFYLNYDEESGSRLTPPSIDPREGFEKERVISLPAKFKHNDNEFEFRTKKYQSGRLVLRTSDQPLTRIGDSAAMNSIDIIGEIGCIGSYRLHELGFMRAAPESEFVYGECEAPFLEDDELDCVRNDREKLVKNELTDALLEWVRLQVEELADEMAEKQRGEKKTRDLRQSALFNQLLDRWKNRFMVKLRSDLFGGLSIGDTFGGAGGASGGPGGGGRGGGGGGGGTGANSTAGSKNPGDKDQGGGSGNQPRPGPRFPRVLLSSHDTDPLNQAGGRLDCDPRNPPVYQRDIDIPEGIFWINTSRPLANKIMDKYGANDARWREYLFQRYVEIILKQAIFELGKRDPDLTSYKVDGLIDEVTSRVHDAAALDLESFLFEDRLTGSTPAAEQPPVEGDAPSSTATDGGAVPSMGEMLGGAAGAVDPHE